jgi:hypothetical protein
MINKRKSKYLQSNAFSLFSLPSTGIKTLNVDMFLFPNERRKLQLWQQNRYRCWYINARNPPGFRYGGQISRDLGHLP